MDSSMSKSSSSDALAPTAATPVREFRVAGMDCASCATVLERALRPLEGVEGVQVDVLGGTVRVARRAGLGNADLALAIRSAGYSVQNLVTVHIRSSDLFGAISGAKIHRRQESRQVSGQAVMLEKRYR